MKTTTKYLDESAKGWFRYIRRIPKNLIGSHEMEGHTTFYWKSLDTKSRSLAEAEVTKINKWFDTLLKQAAKPNTTRARIREVKDNLRLQELLKEDLSLEELSSYSQDKQAEDVTWKELADHYEKHGNPKDLPWDQEIPSITIEEPEYKSEAFIQNKRRLEAIDAQIELLEQKYDDGNGGYKKLNPYDDDVIKLRLMQGRYEDVELESTFEDAIEVYVDWYNKSNPSDDSQRVHWINQIRSQAKRIAKGLRKGLGTPLSELDRNEIRKIAELEWPNANTRNTVLTGRMVPIINCWNREKPNEQLIANPFSSLVGQRAIQKDTKVRRSMTPEEWRIFWSNCEALENPEIRMIGMMIAYVGSPQKETAGMLRGDLKLKDNIPHLLIRNNSLRKLKGKRLERCVPLVEPILSHWRDYIDNHFEGGRNDPLFPRYGQGLYASSARAKVMKPLVKNIQGGEDRLSIYSLRHSFKDRYIAARVPEGVGEYLFGHRTEASSEVHKKYGGLTNPHLLLDDMDKIAKVGEFGYVERFDDD